MSGGSSAPSNTTNQVILPDFINEQARNNLNAANSVADRPFEFNPYKDLVDFNDYQKASYQGFSNIAGATNPYFDQTAAAVQPLLGNLGPQTTDQLNANTQALLNPYSDIVIDPTLALQREELNKSLNAERSRAVQSGSFGGSRLGVLEGTAESEQALKAAQLKGGLLTQGYEAAAGRAQGLMNTNLAAGEWAANLFPQLGVQKQQQTRTDLAALEYVGRAIQQQQQAEQDFAATNWQELRDYPVYQQEIREQALQATPYGSTQVTTGPQKSRNVAAGVLGGVATGASTGAAFGPYGAAIGAVAGGLLGAFGS